MAKHNGVFVIGIVQRYMMDTAGRPNKPDSFNLSRSKECLF